MLTTLLAVLLAAGAGAAGAARLGRPRAAGALVAGFLVGPLLDPAGPAASVLATLAAAVLVLVAGLDVGAPDRRARTRAVRTAGLVAAVLALAALGVLADPPGSGAGWARAGAVAAVLAAGGLAGLVLLPGRLGAWSAGWPWPPLLVLAVATAAAGLAGWGGLAPLAGVAATGLALGGTPAGAAARLALGPGGRALAAPVLLALAGAAIDPAWPPGAALAAAWLAGALAGVAARLALGALATRWRSALALLGLGPVAVAVALGARQAGLLGPGLYGALLAAAAAATLVARPLDEGRPAPDVLGPGPLPAAPDDRLRTVDGVVELVGSPPGEARAMLGLRAARLAGGTGGPAPGPRLAAWLSAGRAEVRWTPALVAELKALIGDGQPGALELLERLDLLACYLPELGAVRARTAASRGLTARPWLQLAALARLAPGPGAEVDGDQATAAAWAALEHPGDLLLAGLVRAVAGDSGADELARQTARRLGLAPASEDTMAVLSGSGADLAAAAVRVDARDEEEVMRLAVALGRPEHARMAYLLAVAETGAGPEWQGWRRRLLDELLAGVLAAMAEPEVTGRSAEELLGQRLAEVADALGDHGHGVNQGAAELLARAPRRWLLAQPPADSARLLALADPLPGEDDLRIAVAPLAGGRWRVDVVARDRPGLLASLTGALAGCGLDVVRAEAWSWPNGLVMDGFEAAGGDGGAGLPARVERAMHRAVAAGPPEPAAPETTGSGEGGPVVVRVEAGASPWHSLVTVEAPARPGLLNDLLVVVAAAGADVQVARAGSEHGHTTGVLFVTGGDGRPLDGAAADDLAARLAAVLTPARPGGGRRRGAVQRSDPR